MQERQARALTLSRAATGGQRLLWALMVPAALLALACGGDDSDSADAGTEVTTAHCDYEPTPGNANSSGTVETATLQAGAAEAVIDIPVGTALGGYTARAGFLGGIQCDVNRAACTGRYARRYDGALRSGYDQTL